MRRSLLIGILLLIVLLVGYLVFFSGGMVVNLEYDSLEVTTPPQSESIQEVPTEPATQCENDLGLQIKFFCMKPPALYPQGSVENLDEKETYRILGHVHDDANRMWEEIFRQAGYSYIPSSLEFQMDYEAFARSGKKGIYFVGNKMVIPNGVTWGQEASELPDIVLADRYTLVMIVAYYVGDHAMRQAVDSSVHLGPVAEDRLRAYLAGIYFYSRVGPRGGFKPENHSIYPHGDFLDGYSSGDPAKIPLQPMGKLA